jgi:hypothetical protein
MSANAFTGPELQTLAEPARDVCFIYRRKTPARDLQAADRSKNVWVNSLT